MEPRWRLRVVYCILAMLFGNLALCQAVPRDQGLGVKIWSHFWFSHTHISYSLCNFPISILSIKGCFLSLPMLKQIAGRTPKKGFWGKMGDDRTYRPIDLKGIYPPRKHEFWCIGRWVTPFLVSCRSARGTKNKKNTEGVNFTPTARRHPFWAANQILRVG